MARMTTARKLLLGLLGGGGAAAFSPLDIPGLALWLDASDASTLFQASNGTTPAVADGDVVGYWGDKSSNARNVTQGTNKPVLKLAVKNGRNVIRFDGINDNLQASFSVLPRPNTLFAVVKSANASGYKIFIDGTGAGNRNVLFHDGTNAAMFAGVTLNLPGTTITNWNLFSLLFDGGSSVGRLNGAQVASGNSGILSVEGLTLGTDYSFTYPAGFDFAELIIVNGTLPVDTRNAVESYLNTKWGVY
jgi:hypothetical protein